MAKSLMLLGCLNNLNVSYQYLAKAEIEHNETLYNKAVDRIRFYRMLENKLLKEANIKRMIAITRLYVESIYRHQIRKSNNEVLIARADVLCGYLSVRIDNLSEKITRKKDYTRTDEFFKDLKKSALIAIKEEIEREENKDIKNNLIELYYFFIFADPEIESEFLQDPSLLNIPSSHLRRYVKTKEPNISVIDFRFEVLLEFIYSFIDKYSEEPKDYRIFCAHLLELAFIDGTLMGLSKKYLYEFKELCYIISYFFPNDYAINKILSLIDKRLKSKGKAKVVSIKTDETYD